MKASEFHAEWLGTLWGSFQVTDTECGAWVVSTFGGGYSWSWIGGFAKDCGESFHDSQQGNARPSFLVA